MFPEWTWIVGLMLGATVGSFLNVVIYRTPRGLSLSNPARSFCPICKHELQTADLIPLFSWLIQGGKCRYCKTKIAPRYFLVELLNGGIWAGIWYQQFVLGQNVGQALAYFAAASTLVAIVFIDWELYIIPDQINAFLWFVGICFNIHLYAIGSPLATTWGIPSALAGWVTGVLSIWGIALIGRLAFGKDAMGHGDIKMARGTGAVVFPAAALMSFGLAVVFGAVLGALQVLARRNVPEPTASAVESEEQEYPPESVGSLLKCGIGYLFCIDILGLFAPKLYEQYFGEPLDAPIDEDEYPIERTMIPFGPYLALGAIGVILFRDPLFGLVDAYRQWAFGGL